MPRQRDGGQHAIPDGRHALAALGRGNRLHQLGRKILRLGLGEGVLAPVEYQRQLAQIGAGAEGPADGLRRILAVASHLVI